MHYSLVQFDALSCVLLSWETHDSQIEIHYDLTNFLDYDIVSIRICVRGI